MGKVAISKRTEIDHNDALPLYRHDRSLPIHGAVRAAEIVGCADQAGPRASIAPMEAANSSRESESERLPLGGE
ncbi:MAG: hypothetical protein D6741_07760, partial [Planctomycetota bacterium]